MIAWMYLNHMSFCLNCLHFSSEVDCMYMHMWVFSIQMSDYTGQRGNSALVYLIFLATASFCSLTYPWGLTPSIVLKEVVKKSEQAGPHHSTGRMVVPLSRPLLHHEKMVSCLTAPYLSPGN